MVGKSLAPFGLPDLKVTGLLPTNLPVIESNELRLDNLFLLDDGSVAIIDYESVFTKENFVKYLNYVARVIKRYADRKQLEELKQIKVFVIYTADVDWAADEYDLGDLILKIEAAYLVGQNTDREQGIEQGIRRGVQALIKTCKNLGVKREEVRNQIEQGFSVSKERAEEYTQMYWE